jgi:hypothetical protein
MGLVGVVEDIFSCLWKIVEEVWIVLCIYAEVTDA